MGAGAEGEVRPCAWKWKWELKSRIENEEGGPRSSSQQIEREKGTWGEEAPRDPRESGVQKANLFFFSLWCISPCGVWGVVREIL